MDDDDKSIDLKEEGRLPLLLKAGVADMLALFKSVYPFAFVFFSDFLGTM